MTQTLNHQAFVQPKFIDHQTILNYIPNLNALTAMRKAFQGLARGENSQPPQTLTLFQKQKGDAITYLGSLGAEDLFAVKVSPYLPGLEGGPVTAWTMLLSLQTGRPLLICDSLALTAERTAATTALAIDLLAPKDAKSLALVGTGRLGQAHLRHALPLRKWTTVTASSLQVAQQDKATLEALKTIRPDIRLERDTDTAIAEADVVMLCTSSGTPVIDVKHLSKDVLVTSISTNVAKAHEIDPASLSSFSVYCDYRATTPNVAGEMVLAGEQHGWSKERVIADLPELVSKPHTRPSGKAFFRSVGLGLEDAAIAAELFKHIAKEQR